MADTIAADQEDQKMGENVSLITDSIKWARGCLVQFGTKRNSVRAFQKLTSWWGRWHLGKTVREPLSLTGMVLTVCAN